MPLHAVIPRYWVGVVSKDHVKQGVQLGIGALGHGKRAPLARLSPGDLLFYYSPKRSLSGREPCQCFTALGRVLDAPIEDVPVPVADFPAARMSRRHVAYLPSVDAPIRPLLPHLAFVANKAHWGATMRRGLIEISHDDAMVIAAAMEAAL